ncbi:hypothetical protein [Pseudomonas sp. Pseu.R1]|uniref:hypothetical protein n=1 Tax=Pseudomonas sp. Pseu.R1 TaxID=3379818 RepID=UPI003B94D7FB
MRIPRAPEGVNLTLNLHWARQKKVLYKYGRGALLWRWFYEQVRNGGPWDFKQQGAEYQDFGNFHYGAVGTAAGFSSLYFSELQVLPSSGRVQRRRT